MFRQLLTRESAAPSWGELARVYRTFEARGEIRGGRFVVGPSGERFALADAVAALRKVRDHAGHTPWTVISTADPLTLSGFCQPLLVGASDIPKHLRDRDHEVLKIRF